MVRGNLLLESETFRLTEDEFPFFAERIEAFALVVDKCRECGDSIYGKGDLSYVNLANAPLYEYCDPEKYDMIRQFIPDLSRDMYVFLTYDLLNYDNKSYEACTTLDQLEAQIPAANNGLLGPECDRFGCTPELTVYNEESWYCWKVAYLTKHPNHIVWKDDHSYLPNLTYSNLLLGVEFRSRFDNKDHTDFYKKVGTIAGPLKNALSLEVGNIIAKANFYQYDDRVSKLNNNSGQIRDIYSLNIKGRQVYLSIDVDNAAFEVCDHNGQHQGEYLFDGGESKKADKSGGHDIRVD